MARHAFIVGGAGQIGRAVAASLIGQGWRVTIASRGQRPLEDLADAALVQLDRDQPGALALALGEGADAVIDTVAYDQRHADQLLDIQDRVGAFVVISTAGVYCDATGKNLGAASFTGPLDEQESTVPPGPDTYASRKVALERRLLDRATAPVTILRPCAIHGRFSTGPREWWFVKRMLDARPVIPLAYRGAGRFHTSAVANIAALAALALDRPAANRILNIGDPNPPTVAQIGAAIAAHMGYGGRLLPLDIGKAEAPVGDTPWTAPSSLVLDMTAATALGYQPVTTYEAAVGAVCDALATPDARPWQARFPVLAGYPGELFDYAAEDALLAQFGSARR